MKRVVLAWGAVALGLAALAPVTACTHTPDDPPAGPDCARASKDDAACIDYTRSCNVDAQCAPRAGVCADGNTALTYAGPVCESGNCGYSVTVTTCACQSGGCPGDAGTD